MSQIHFSPFHFHSFNLGFYLSLLQHSLNWSPCPKSIFFLSFMLSPSSLTRHLRFVRDFYLQQLRVHYFLKQLHPFAEAVKNIPKARSLRCSQSIHGCPYYKTKFKLRVVCHTFNLTLAYSSDLFSYCKQNPKLQQHHTTGSPPINLYISRFLCPCSHCSLNLQCPLLGSQFLPPLCFHGPLFAP